MSCLPDVSCRSFVVSSIVLHGTGVTASYLARLAVCLAIEVSDNPGDCVLGGRLERGVSILPSIAMEVACRRLPLSPLCHCLIVPVADQRSVKYTKHSFVKKQLTCVSH